MQMYLQRISVKIHCNLLTFGLLRIIELLKCHGICQIFLMKHEEQFLKSCLNGIGSINMTLSASWILI